MKSVRFVLFSTLLLLQSIAYSNVTSNQPLRYYPENGWIVSNSATHYNNRPIYINNTNAFILAGEKPLLRLVKDNRVFGCFMAWLSDEKKTIRLDSLRTIKSSYKAGEMKWELSDARFKNIKIELHTLPSAEDLGMVLCMNVKGLGDAQQLKWAFTGSKEYKGNFEIWSSSQAKNYDIPLSWLFDVMGHPEILKWGAPSPQKESALQKMILTNQKSYWLMKINGDSARVIEGTPAQKAYEKAVVKLNKVRSRLQINTPDSYLNAAALASLNAIDGTWYDPVFVHGCMQWNVPLPGWRTIFGGTMYGWHDRVKKEGKYYIDSQVKESDKKTAKADPGTLLTEQDLSSRFYGKGRILKDQLFYNMQSQFFDQMIEEYRWTNDTAFVRMLRPALELHLNWQQECFDPDGDGVYESYINSWPSDSQWYNGGGSAEETSYAYRGHRAARDMALAAKDRKSADFHAGMMAKIRSGFFRKLWINSKGYAGAYREQGGYERLHENPWTYSIFLPIDAGMTSPVQSLQSLNYTETVLQNDTTSTGGRRVWASNWVPAIWSVRQIWPGDNYHLALAYFQSGMANDGWDILRGNFMETAFNHLVPGNLGSIQGGIDFGDCIHPFARTLVSGLFGYTPDYPNGKVSFSPQFPTKWDHASIALPDFSVSFVRKGNQLNYRFTLKEEAEMNIRIPVSCTQITGVSVNDKAVKWKMEAGPGYSWVSIQQKACNEVSIEIRVKELSSPLSPVRMNAVVGGSLQLSCKGYVIDSILDPEKICISRQIDKAGVTLKLGQKSGYNSLFVFARKGETAQWLIYRLKISDPVQEAKDATLSLKNVPSVASWTQINMDSLKNADVREIYKQKYLSPRPNTVSVRLGSNGYSPWTFHHWRTPIPEIGLDKAGALKSGENQITACKVPFRWNATQKNNILFTSLWDNYPREVSIKVGDKAKAIYFLVCGSTNVMQCNIANAVIEVHYADGSVDDLKLVPPLNYWNLSPIDPKTPSPDQESRTYYTTETDRFCLPKQLPETVELGKNCTAMILNLSLKPNMEVSNVKLKTLSQEVVVGLIGISLLK